MAIAVPATDFPAEERALLRVEYKAGQTQATEAGIVGDILARVQRMDGMIKDIHGLVEAWPQAGLAPAPSPAAIPSPVHATPRPTPTPMESNNSASSSDTPLTMRALMASVIVFLFWLLGKRHVYIKTQHLKAAAAPNPATTPT
ncbi:MAG: hypothetical protein Q8O25_05390 [Sulfurisoma sp.]|nr:hypothetical protein [Sulfurisoma sp.]